MDNKTEKGMSFCGEFQNPNVNKLRILGAKLLPK